jgi:photosystem II stability/assembly factor-like uncharacterized protein
MKKSYIIFYFLFIFIFISTITSSGQWVRTSGPEGGLVDALGCYGNSTIYAAPRYDGVYKSTDNGLNWKSSGLINHSICGFFFKDNYVFAIDGNGGLYRSIDNGNTWTVLSFTQFSWGYTVKGNFILAATSEGIYRSSDNGNTFTNISSQYIYAMTSNNNYIFTGSYGKVYRSSDNGLNWLDISTGIPADASPNIMITNGSNIFIGMAGERGVYLSTNNGNNWKFSGLDSLNIMNIVKFNNSIFAVSYGGFKQDGIYRTNDNGLTWKLVNSDLISNHLTALTANSSFIFTGLFQMGVSRSATKGNDWVVKNSGLKTMTFSQMVSLDNDLYACNTGAGIYYSHNNGSNWTDYNLDLTNLNVNSLAVDKDNYIVYACTDEGVFYTSETNDVWTPANNGLTDLKILTMSVKGLKLYAGTYRTGFFRSTDGGKNWNFANLSGRINQSALGTDVIYAAVASTHGKPLGSLKYSTDNGYTWTEIYSGSIINTLIANGNDVYWGTTDGVFRSIDKGTGWTKVVSGITDTNITSLTYFNNKIVAGTASGKVYISGNKGNSWSSISSGALNNYAFTTLASNNNYLFGCMENNSIWKYTNSSSTLTEINNINSKIKNFELCQNLPNPFNPVTKIRFEIPDNYKGHVSLKIFDMLGKELETLVNTTNQSGVVEVFWDGSKYSSGAYFYKLETDEFTKVNRMILIK